VNFILEDGQGRLWVSHDRGIYRVRKSDLDAVAAGQRPWVPCVNYDEADGMLARETSGERCQPAGCRARDGRLWFATAKGVVAIDPSRVQTNAVPPPVAVEQVIADGELVYAQGAGLAAALADRRAEPEPPERRPGVRRTLGPSFRLPHLDEIGQTARDSLRTLSQTIWTLEPVSASLARVADYIGDFAQRLFSAAGVRCRVEVPPNWPDAELGARERHAVLAAAKESFYNILKHAAATEVQLRFEVAERAFRLTIQDNGRGFAAGLPPPNLKPEISNSKPTSGHGLRNLALRLTELGGHFRCDSRPGQGTTAVISIPLTSPPAGAQTADANSP
jgi:two-component sensor histidine kinase